MVIRPLNFLLKHQNQFPLFYPLEKSSERIPCAVPLQPPRSQHRGQLRPTVTSCDPATNCDLLPPAPPRPSLVRMALALNFLLPLQLLGTKAEVLPTGTQRTTPHVLKSSNEMSGQNPTAKPRRGGGATGGVRVSPLRLHFLLREKSHPIIHWVLRYDSGSGQGSVTWKTRSRRGRNTSRQEIQVRAPLPLLSNRPGTEHFAEVRFPHPCSGATKTTKGCYARQSRAT